VINIFEYFLEPPVSKVSLLQYQSNYSQTSRK